jgi:hypothetical protein
MQAMYLLMANCEKQTQRESLAVACFKTLLRKGHAKLDRFYSVFQSVKFLNTKITRHRQNYTKNPRMYKLGLHNFHPEPR